MTWEWNRDLPSVYLYQISYEIVGGMPGIGPVFVRQTVPDVTRLASTVTVTLGVPQGRKAKLCVHVYASDDKTAPLPAGASCVEAVAP